MREEHASVIPANRTFITQIQDKYGFRLDDVKFNTTVWIRTLSEDLEHHADL